MRITGSFPEIIVSIVVAGEENIIKAKIKRCYDHAKFSRFEIWEDTTSRFTNGSFEVAHENEIIKKNFLIASFSLRVKKKKNEKKSI